MALAARPGSGDRGPAPKVVSGYQPGRLIARPVDEVFDYAAEQRI